MNRAQEGRDVLQAQSRAKRKRAVLGAFADTVQSNDPTEPNHALQVAQLLCDPEPNISRPANEGCVGKARIERRQRVEARRSREEDGLVANEHILMVGESAERGSARLRRRSETIGRLADSALQRRRNDRAITGASTEVARQLVAKPRICHRLTRMVGGEQAHYDTGRTEAAL